MKPGFSIFMVMAAFIVSACATVTGRVPETPSGSENRGVPSEVQTLLVALEHQNVRLKTFKGTGKFKFWNKGRSQVARVAWVGSFPDRIRIAVRNLSGQPAASLATDGEWLYLVSHTEGKFYKKRTEHPSLESFISIPIRSKDIVAMLAGRIPVLEHASAEVIKNTAGEGYVMVLKKGWRRVIEKIFLDESKKEVRRVEMFDWDGSLSYRAEFDNRQEIDGYRVPLRLRVFNEEDAGFQLDIDQYWTDVSVSSSTFVLTPPEQEVKNPG